MLSLYAEKLPGARVLEGRYTVIRHAIATERTHTAAAACIRTFIEQVKADGTVRDAVQRAGLHRASVAGPAE